MVSLGLTFDPSLYLFRKESCPVSGYYLAEEAHFEQLSYKKSSSGQQRH